MFEPIRFQKNHRFDITSGDKTLLHTLFQGSFQEGKGHQLLGKEYES